MLDFWEAYERGIQKISWGTSQFVDWAACAVLNRSKMVLSGDVPSNCSLASFRHARFFDFFNEIGHDRKARTATTNGRSGAEIGHSQQRAPSAPLRRKQPFAALGSDRCSRPRNG